MAANGGLTLDDTFEHRHRMLAEEIEDADRRARRDLGPGQLIGIAGGETKWKRDVVSVEQDRGFVDEHMTGIEAVFSSHTPVSGHQKLLEIGRASCGVRVVQEV